MKQRFKLSMLLFSVGVITGSSLFAQKQGQVKIDSLVNVLANMKEDTNKVNILNDIAGEYSNINTDYGVKYGQMAFTLATKIDFQKGVALSEINLGVNVQNKSDYLKALEYYEDAAKIYEDLDEKRGITNAMADIGSAYEDLSDYPKALEYDLKALKLYEEAGNKNKIAVVTNNIGNVYESLRDFQNALEYYLKSLKIAEEIKDKNRIAATTGNLGNFYFFQKNYPKALEYYFKTVQMNEEMGNKEGVARNIGNIALAYSSEKNYPLAIEQYERALKMSEETGYKHGVAWNLEAIGETYLAMSKDTVHPGKVNSGQLHTAINYLQRGVAMARELRTMGVLQDAYQYLAEAYKLNGDYKNALECTANYDAIKDSVFSKENDEKIVKLGMQHEYDKKADEAQKIAALRLQRQQNYTYMSIAGILLLTGFSFFIVKERRKSDIERKKSDNLLLNILPAEVANELKMNGNSKTRQFDNVTVLFTDFVNFTNAGERMTPQALIDELHTCFKAFDDITDKYNVEKIKTIGDAYLAVAGLPVADPKHAENIVSAAIEINNYMTDRLTKLGNSTFEIRIGIHTGSVVAGIVGVKKFAYDIWGDTVNTAARMEQSGAPGKINISQNTYELVKDKFTCTYRGEIEAKNKGTMKMYFVS